MAFHDHELLPWVERTANPGHAPALPEDELERLLDTPGLEACWRAAVEPELHAMSGLDPAGLVQQAQSLLEEGRLCIAHAHTEAVFDPRHPAGNSVEDLGNLSELAPADRDDEAAANEDVAEPPRPTWIEIAVVDGLGQPVRNRPYRLHLPDGSVRAGTLDDTGIIRFDDVAAGPCKLELPTADANEWDPFQSSGEAAA